MTPPAPDADWRGLHPRLLVLRRLRVPGACSACPPLVAAGVAARTRAARRTAVAALLVGAVLLGAAAVRRAAALRRLGLRRARGRPAAAPRAWCIRRTSVVPYGRMQYVDVTAGPLDRRLGLATVVLHTAAAATDASHPRAATPRRPTGCATASPRSARPGQPACDRACRRPRARRSQDGPWRRLHPLTPLLRSGRFLLAVVAVARPSRACASPPLPCSAACSPSSSPLALAVGLPVLARPPATG